MGLVALTGCTATAPGPVRSSVVTDAAASDPAATAATTLDAVQDFWRQAFPVSFGTGWVELRGGLRPLDSGADGDGALCIATPDQITGNAYYCPADDGIVYDTGVLVPVLTDHYGTGGLTASLAHEFGHAVAARLGAPAEPLFRELQADCLAGAALAALIPADQRITALAPLLDFGDQPSVTPADATAHGLSVDRAQGALLGLRGGPPACRDVGPGDIDVTLGRLTPPASRAPRDLPPVTVSDADRALAAPLGDAALAAAARLTAAAGDDTARGCTVGRWMAEVFGEAGPDAVGGRLTDPDEALTFLRTRPDTSPDVVVGYLDGFAGRC
ncbi:hypothetical protein [Nakamurella deserti]|uniref:hypothetical protein n=1 Tax=Nakamurella deserti TaxID=2164074 RepID=UPI0013008607|nr:hypothetical protein [Nakamurella deserti]